MSKIGPSICGALLLLVQGAMADSLASPPAAWRERVDPVPELDVSGADASLQRAITQARIGVARLLAGVATGPPRLGDAYGHLGALYHLTSVTSGAEDCYRNAVRLAPASFRWHYYLAELLRESGRPAEAESEQRRAAALDPGYRTLDLRRAQVAQDLGREAEAEGGYAVLTQVPGLQAMAHYQLGLLALEHHAAAAAQRHLERALALDPRASRVHYPLAQALRALGRQDQARAQLALLGDRLPQVQDPLMEELHALDHGARAHFVAALEAVKRRDFAAAARAFAQGLKMDPDNLNARVSLARTLYLTGDTSGARRELGRVLSAQPGHALAGFLSGLMLQEAGQGQAAEDRYRAVLAEEPDQAGAHFYLAGLLLRRGDAPAAAMHYAAAVQANPDNLVAAVLRLVALERSGRPSAEVAAALTGLLRSHPDDPQLRYAAARLLALTPEPAVRDPERALSLAQALARQMPSPQSQRLLALTQAAAGDLEAARATLGQLALVPPWMLSLDLEHLRKDLESLAAGHSPLPAWPADDPILQPPPLQVSGPMADYPTAVPY
jgi:Tfp pilus assembly protein PilF